MQTLGIEITTLQSAAADLGLVLNETKCEILGLTEQSRLDWKNANLQFFEPAKSDTTLLELLCSPAAFSLPWIGMAKRYPWHQTNSDSYQLMMLTLFIGIAIQYPNGPTTIQSEL